MDTPAGLVSSMFHRTPKVSATVPAGDEPSARKRNFGVTQRALRLALLIAVAVPLACLSAYGYYDYRQRFHDAQALADRLARVAQEQAAKVLDLNQELLVRVLAALGDRSPPELRMSEAGLHAQIASIADKYPQIQSIAVFGPDGKMVLSSGSFPAAPVSIATRDDFEGARSRHGGIHVSGPLYMPVSGDAVFSTSIARFADDGSFLGVVTVALRRSYFDEYYRELTSGDSAIVVGLQRDGGKILVRYPPVAATELGRVSGVVRRAFDQPLNTSLRTGTMRTVSSVDGVERIYAFRRVEQYPVLAVSGYSTAAIYATWSRSLAVLCAALLLPCIAVWLLLLFSLRLLRAEQLASERWRDELEARTLAQQEARQAQRMSALGNLVASVAHDFNNLLMVVASNVEIARHKGYNNLHNEVQTVAKATANAEALTRRLLSITRKQPLHNEVIDFSIWLAAVRPLIQTALGSHIALDLDIAPDVWKALADPSQLEIAIINIAVNARDAMPDGGRFLVRCHNSKSETPVGGRRPGEFVVLSLTDTGSGMTEETLRHAFEPLFTTKAVGKGTGLGLPQVLAMCQDAGGTAFMESKLGVGTTVHLYLPRYVGPDLTADTSPGETTWSPPSDATEVLLVEDNAEVAAGLAAVLDVFGCKVHHELTADDALGHLNAGHRFDVILTDVHMPGRLNGIDLAEQVLHRWPTQKIALMTGYAEELERAKRLRIRVMAKPFNMDQLASLLAKE